MSSLEIPRRWVCLGSPHQSGSQLFRARHKPAVWPGGRLTLLPLSKSPEEGGKQSPLPRILPHSRASRQILSSKKGWAVCVCVQAKATGQGAPRTEATSDAWVRPTLVYRPSCPGYFTTEPEPVPSELDSTDELTCNTTKQPFLVKLPFQDTCHKHFRVFAVSVESSLNMGLGRRYLHYYTPWEK